jgi:hypothetical protein
MADRGRFVFFDEWRLAAPPDEVWAVVRDLPAWPEWWSSVRRTTRLAPRTADSHEAWEFRFRTRLPYDMTFVADLLVEDSELRVDARVTGRVDGHGIFRVEPVDGGALVRFDWEVRPLVTWMRAAAPVARPLFSWNHRALMAEGAFGLARRLDAGLLAAPVGVLLPA